MGILNRETWKRSAEMTKLYDLIIIGSGPAGLAAAIYAQRARLNTLVLEKAAMSGGQVLNTYEVDNYPGMPGMNGFDLGMKFRQHADRLEAEFVEDEVLKIVLATEAEMNSEDEFDAEPTLQTEPRELQAAELRRSFSPMWKKVVGKKGNYLTKTVIIASGATHRRLGAPGEDRLAGRGISYCATCDGAFFKKKVTAVVGGGDVALEDAIFLSRLCSHVYLIHRRDELRGAKVLQEKLFSLDNVTVVWDSVVEDILGEQRVTGVSLKNVKTGEAFVLDVDGVFIAVGILPNSQAFEGVVEMDHGYIQADENGNTSVPGIYAAGDVRTKQLRQIVTAVADGANAVTSVERYLTEY